MEMLVPFANSGDKEDFSIVTDPSGKVSLEKGFTERYELRPEEGGLFILRKVFNKMMNLVSTDTVTWKIQSFPNWIEDKGDGLPYSYGKNAIVKATNGENYVSLENSNTDNPIGSTKWANLKDFGKENISITGTATFNGTTQNINLTNIGNITLAIGDVIEVSGTTSNNKLFTVESITDNNNIVVNYEHRGTSTPIPSKRLINETATNCTIKLYNRAKNSPLGQGQGWCIPASARAVDINYPNNTNRTILSKIKMVQNGRVLGTIEGIEIVKFHALATADEISDALVVPSGMQYRYSSGGGSILNWLEFR